ncbi:MAG: substrate-binding domain-containing protein [Candidatus Poribacteria bacterium]|nr:substrate-binding domain-containing protein [Candidatus Poribacteria bacterium]
MRAGACGLLWAALVCFLGCHEEAPSRTVGVLSFTRESPVNAAVERELIKYAEEQDVRAVWIDEDDFEPDLTREQSVRRALHKMLNKEQIEALILRQADPKYAERILQTCGSDMPVLFLDTLPPDLAVDGFVTVDYRSAGREAAEYALQQAHRRRKVERILNAVVVEGPRGNQEDRLAAAGIYSVLDDDPNVRIVARYSPKDPSDAFRFVSYELQKYADNIQILLSADPEFGSAAVFAAAARGSANAIESASVGSSRETSRRIRSGEHDLDIDTMPAAAAQRALEIALQLVNDESPPPDAFTRQGPLLTATYYAPRRRITIDNVSEMFAIWPNLSEE